MLRLRLSAGNKQIADFQLPIADWLLAGGWRFRYQELAETLLAIGNWQSEIDND
jgi:hypothetical protein